MDFFKSRKSSILFQLQFYSFAPLTKSLHREAEQTILCIVIAGPVIAIAITKRNGNQKPGATLFYLGLQPRLVF